MLGMLPNCALAAKKGEETHVIGGGCRVLHRGAGRTEMIRVTEWILRRLFGTASLATGNLGLYRVQS